MSYIDHRPKTIICDIDGTLVYHCNPHTVSKSTHKMELLTGTIEKLLEWERKGYNIILLTGRKESIRKVTEQQLSEIGIFYDQLIMGVGGGTRYLINDFKPNGEEAAFAINVERNKGINDIIL
jgi:hydroxymethylpyrimidine pyrophosphatase-like HAD family hydrolase